MNATWKSRKSTIILTHIIVWILFFLLTIVTRPSFNNESNSLENLWNRERNMFFMNAFQLGFFYLNAYYLLPQLAFKKKYVSLIVSWIGCFFLLATCIYVLKKCGIIQMPEPMRNMAADSFHRMHNLTDSIPPSFNPRPNFPRHSGPGMYFSPFFPFIMMLGLSSAFRLITDKIETEQISKEKENEGLKTELSFLRSQTSPHFLFNIMNSLVAMARLKSDQLEPSLIKMSGLLRYMLYDTDEKKVPVTHEIDFLESYIDLQKIRFDDSIAITLNITNDDSVASIEPMLLIPFVENAFKHGAAMINNPFITIDLSIKDKALTFTVLNKFNPQHNEVQDNASGIGLVNVSRRLKLLHPENHLLEVTNDEDLFRVFLTLKF